MAAQSMTMALDGAGLQSILHRAAQGSPEAFSELYASHYRYVLWVCRRYCWRPEDAEDAAAEVFLKLHSVLGSHAPSQPFRPWLSQVASRHCLDRLRRGERERRHRVDQDEIAALPDETTASPLAQVLRNEKLRHVEEQLNRLPERHRLPLVLHYYKEMSYQEMARVLGRSLPIVKALLFRARRELRRNMKRPEGTARIDRLAGNSVPASPFSPVVSEACGAD